MMKNLLPNSRKHDITFHASGQIDISAHVARKLSLSNGDVIGFSYDCGELFIYVKLRAGKYTGMHVGRVWSTNHGKGTFRAHSRKLTGEVMGLSNSNGDRLRCPCGMEVIRDNIKYITIIHRCSL